MCGVVGYVGGEPALPKLLEGLRRLEYRGYDSAGVAVLGPAGIAVRKRPGRVGDLAGSVSERDLPGTIGIAHTRWATHGGVTEANAHPHLDCEGRIAIVHNGIIERSSGHRERLSRLGHRFRSETDSEVIAHEIEERLRGRDPATGLLRAVAEALAGFSSDAWAVAVIHAGAPDRIVAARNRSPLVLGKGEPGLFLASDGLALAPFVKRVWVLEDGEIGSLDRRAGEIAIGPIAEAARGGSVAAVARPAIRIAADGAVADKGAYPHFMLKEIHEQPDALRRCLGACDGILDAGKIRAALLKRAKRVQLVACGTAYHACLVGKMAIEELAGVPAAAALGSEFRYGFDPVDKGTLCVAVSQSGETADTLASAEEAKGRGARLLAIVNVGHSTLARLSDAVLPTCAGPEVGVASTKAYTTQIAALLRLAVRLGEVRGALPPERAAALRESIRRLPAAVEEVLLQEPTARAWAERHKGVYNFLYVGRGYNLATAYEGALKLKEISYIHAEGYGAGEMKHGPIALVTDQVPTVAVAVEGRVLDKILSNIEEIRARRGKVLLLTNDPGAAGLAVDGVLRIPAGEECLTPVTAVVPLQLLAYHVAALLGRDVDKPRNLAKSVTVE